VRDTSFFITMSSRECPTCCHDYDSEHHRVRILSCGHSQCTSCMRAQFANSRITCSTCRTIHTYDNVNKIPVCYIAEILFGEKDAAPLIPKLNKGICEDHAAYKLFWCSTHKQWICPHCSVIDHPRGDCDIIQIKKQLENDKNVMKLNVSEEIKHLDSTDKEVKLVRDELDKKKKEDENQIKKMKEEIDKLTKLITQKEKDISLVKVKQSKVNTLTQDCKKKKGELENLMTRICDVNDYKELDLEMDKSASIINRFENWKQGLKDEACSQELGKTKKISLFDDVLTGIQRHPCAILTLTCLHTNICHLLISLKGPVRRLQQFTELASGNSRNGSYKNSKIEKIIDKSQPSERVWFKWYYSASGVKQENALCELEMGGGDPFIEGAVYGVHRDLAGFSICTRSNPDDVTETWSIIGHVISGLPELKAAIQIYDPTDIMISRIWSNY
ncbi:unnamed protein product, partial [Meganyctiphanes norvegica]